MKTRSNMPLFVVECSDIKALSNSQIDLLRCGDYLVKKTGKQEHSYKVVYKQDDEMSLVYCDYHNIEEVYYEKNAQGNWVWVSTEIKNLDNVPSVSDVNTQITNLVEGGTLSNAKPIYFHPIRFNITGSSGGQEVNVINGSIMILNNDNTPLDTSAKLMNYLFNQGNQIDIICSVDFYDSNGLYQGQILGVTASEGNFVCNYTKNGATTTLLYLATSEFVVSSDTVNKIN